MTRLTDKDFSAIGRNEFSLDFLKATLVQQVESSPKSFSGPGSVWQDSEGRLQLKMFVSIIDQNELVDIMNELGGGFGQAGKLIAADTYYSFRGFDPYGHEWTAVNVSLNGDISHPMSGRIVRSEIRALENVESRPMAEGVKTRQLFVIRGDVKIPYTHSQVELRELGSSTCELQLGEGRVCEISQKRDAIHLLLTLLPGDDAEYGAATVQAVGVAAGAELLPQVETRLIGGRFTQIIRSRSGRTEHLRLSTPIPMNYSGDFKSFELFVSKFGELDRDAQQQIAGFWHRVLAGVSGSTENQALILATAIEGILKACFPTAGNPDEEFIRQLDEAEPLVRGLKLSGRARERILTSIAGARESTTNNALRSLVDAGDLPKALAKAWKALRNKLVHADELDWDTLKTQQFLDDWFSCLELFYRLIMLKTGYEGICIRYSRHGWREEPRDAFKSEASE